MTRIAFIQPDGSRKEVEARDGYSLMEVARMGGVAGIIGECGGGAICGTCHIKPEDGDRLPPVSLLETDVLEFEGKYEEGKSRLACQIFCGPELDGMTFVVATTED